MDSAALDTGNVIFIVITTILFFSVISGLAFFYVGLVPKKNSLTMMMYTLIAIDVVA